MLLFFFLKIVEFLVSRCLFLVVAFASVCSCAFSAIYIRLPMEALSHNIDHLVITITAIQEHIDLYKYVYKNILDYIWL